MPAEVTELVFSADASQMAVVTADKRLTIFAPISHIKGEVNREGIRKMTPREWARLQGFPDDFRLELADTHLYKQLGNSVTVNVIEEIAKEIRKVLENDK